MYSMLLEVIKKMIPVGILILTILGLSFLLKPVTIFAVVLVIYIPVLSFQAFVFKTKHKDMISFGWSQIKTIGMITLFVVLLRLLSRWGWLGLIIIVLGIAAYRILVDVRSEDSLYMKAMRSIEERIFGRSLDKKNWRK